MQINGRATYVMGETEQERRRLLLQGSVLNPTTERFLLEAGLSAGMRVLDLGCGIGDVSLIAARIVGPHGSVVGLDRDGAALETAQIRASEEDLPQATFKQVAFEAYSAEGAFDAVIGRHVLIHAPDPRQWIRKAKSLLRTGGIVAFQEYDLSYFPPVEPALPLFHKLSGSLVTLFRRIAAYADTGARLYHWMQLEGLCDMQCSGTYLMSGGSESPYYEWFAETVRSVAPHLESLGVVGAAELDLPTLADRLREEAVSNEGCITTPPIVGCSARRP